MGLRDLLESMGKRHVVYGVKELPELSLARAVRHLESRISEAGGEVGEPPDAFVNRIRNLWASQQSLDRLSARDLRGIAYFLHRKTDDGTDSFAENQNFLTGFIDAFSARPSSMLARTLTSSFLLHFGEVTSSDQRLAAALNGLSDEASPPFLRGLKLAGLIDVKNGPQRLSLLISKEPNIEQEITRLGFDGILSRSAFVANAYEHFCRDVAKNESDPKVGVKKVFDWGVSDIQTEKETFPSKTSATVDALLLPWANTRAHPPKSLETKIKSFLISALGDPRFKVSSARWSTVSDEARIILKRWMNRASVAQFFDIVDSTMNTPDAKRMWRYRRAFWTAYMDDITDAWVVFGSRGASLAMDAARRSADNSLREFGTFSTGGAGPTHAVLILTIGDLLIGEWSHNGACRMWTSSRRSIEPYQKFYSVPDLRSSRWKASHTSNESYGWQQHFAAKILAETGVRKRVTDYKV